MNPYIARTRSDFTPDPTELAAWTAEVATARAAYATRDAELDRAQRLYVGRVMAEQRRRENT